MTNIKRIFVQYYFLVGVAMLTSLFAVAVCIYHVRFNLTGSMPRGIYAKQPSHMIHRGDTVAVCLPSAISKEGMQRGYLSHGSCANGAVPVVKKVIGMPGDEVLLTSQQFCIAGQCYPVRSHRFDHAHHVIKSWVKKGFQKLVSGYWLYGDNDPDHSWDSRYFGAIKAKNFIGIYKPLWVTQ